VCFLPLAARRCACFGYEQQHAERQQNVIAGDSKRLTILHAVADKDSEALATYAGANDRDPDLYWFWRTLEYYKLALANNTTIIQSTVSEHPEFLEGMLKE
jgi:hypothetical protein